MTQPTLDAAAAAPVRHLGPRAAASISGRDRAPSAAARADAIRAIGASIPGLARKRLSTPEERNAGGRAYVMNAREARNSGRPAPVGDPTQAGAQVGGVAVSAPFLSPGPSKAQRLRDSLVWKQNADVRARLQARLDSVLRNAAHDSAVAASRMVVPLVSGARRAGDPAADP